MASDPNAVEQAVSRTLRDNLEKIQRTADELHQAVNDMVAACASSRASNALPPMLRAQTSAASLAATLEVLSRFVTGAVQPAMRMPFEPEMMRVPSLNVPPIPAFEPPPPPIPHPKEEISCTAPAPVPVLPKPKVPEIPPPPPPPVEQLPVMPEIHPPLETPAFNDISPAVETPSAVEAIPEVEAAIWSDLVPETPLEAAPEFELELPGEEQQAVEEQAAVELAEATPAFNIDLLPPDEQELHRRAFRVAKVSMQDIRMLRPEDVRLGREKKDLCFRLRDDIEKAHKEYDRRFQSIQSHPVDYFYDWMVEILGGGDPQALGEYPYPTAVLRR
jgi:uncharacterized damage-inducible protein DinB